MKIGDVSELINIGIETLRYYEKIDLLLPANRTTSGYRIYDHRTIERLNFIQSAKSLGFNLKEIKEFLILKMTDRDDCHDVRNQVVEKLRDVEEKIRKLQQIKKSLNHLLEDCDGHDLIEDCPILKYFSASKG